MTWGVYIPARSGIQQICKTLLVDVYNPVSTSTNVSVDICVMSIKRDAIEEGTACPAAEIMYFPSIVA